MTSPEEEIPMDTHMTPTEETATDLPIVSRPIKDDVGIAYCTLNLNYYWQSIIL